MTLSLKESIAQASRLPDNESILLHRLGLLEERDRALLEAILIKGQKARHVAALMGLSTGAVRRRVAGLVRQITSPDFTRTAKALPYLPEGDARFARMVFCEGKSEREMARLKEVTLHAIRRRKDHLRARISEILTLLKVQPQALPARTVSELLRAS